MPLHRPPTIGLRYSGGELDCVVITPPAPVARIPMRQQTTNQFTRDGFDVLAIQALRFISAALPALRSIVAQSPAAIMAFVAIHDPPTQATFGIAR